jgi:hypothetical protein
LNGKIDFAAIFIEEFPQFWAYGIDDFLFADQGHKAVCQDLTISFSSLVMFLSKIKGPNGSMETAKAKNVFPNFHSILCAGKVHHVFQRHGNEKENQEGKTFQDAD